MNKIIKNTLIKRLLMKYRINFNIIEIILFDVCSSIKYHIKYIFIIYILMNHKILWNII